MTFSPAKSLLLLLWLTAAALPASAQQSQCRTPPVGTSTATCASEAFVTSSRIVSTGVFSSFATCAPALEGSLAAVTDSTTVVWGATITGAGANHVLAYCDGAHWTVTGK